VRDGHAYRLGVFREDVGLPGDDDDPRGRVRFGDTEGIMVPADDKHAGSRLTEFGVTGLLRLTWRMERERQGDHADGVHRCRCPAGDPRAV
jgi:hypothetical protein